MPLYALFIEDEISALPVAEGKGVRIPTRAGDIHVAHSAFMQEAGHTRVMKAESWAPLSVEQLLSAEPLPGRAPIPGLVGCTVQVSGNYNSVTERIEVAFLAPLPEGAGEPIAEPFPRVVIGPPERVVGGPVTIGLAEGLMHVAKATIQPVGDGQPINDQRLPQLGPRNDFGIPIALAQVKAIGDNRFPGMVTPALATVNGWWSLPDDPASRHFMGYDIVVDTTDRSILLDPTKPQIGITKAQARRRGTTYDINVQGGITAWIGDPAGATTILRNPQRIRVNRLDFDPKKNEWVEDKNPIGFVNDVRIVPGKPFAKWQLKVSHGLAPDRPYPPMKVKASMISDDATLLNGGIEPVTQDSEELVEWIKG